MAESSALASPVMDSTMIDSKSASPTPPPSQSQSIHHAHLSASSLPTPEPLNLSDERIRQAHPEELRAIISSLTSSLQEARSDAARYKLQHNMLAIQSAEAVERIQVEMEISHEPRIVHVQSKPDPNMRHVHVDMYHSMVQEIQDLRSQNANLENTVSHQKRMVVQQEGDIATLNDRISLLRERLRENRQHMNRYRRAAGFDTSPYPSSTQPSPISGRARDQPHFSALLHASDMLGERGPLTPRTPRRRRAPSTTPTPMTPQTVQPRLSRNLYDTPQSSQSVRHLQIPQTAPPLRGPTFVPAFIPQAVVAAARGRDSEGTVSAAEDSEAETEVPEHPSHRVEDQPTLGAPRTPTRNADTNRNRLGLAQGRLFGHVRKGGAQRGGVDERAKGAEQSSNKNLNRLELQ